MQQQSGVVLADLASVLLWSRESERNKELPGYHGSSISHLFSIGNITGGTTEHSIFNWWGCTVKSIFFRALWLLQTFRGKLLMPKGKTLPQVQVVKSLKLYIISTNFNIYYHKVEWMELTIVVQTHANMGRVQGALTLPLNTKA